MSFEPKRRVGKAVRTPGPIGWLLDMADNDVPSKFLPAVKVAVFWVGLPFVGLLLGSEAISAGKPYEAVAWLGCTFISIMIAVYWDKIFDSINKFTTDH
jgi:hypothetical protein